MLNNFAVQYSQRLQHISGTIYHTLCSMSTSARTMRFHYEALSWQIGVKSSHYYFTLCHLKTVLVNG